MLTAVNDLLRSGQLDEAIAAMNNEVRQNPTDVGRRGQLAELLCFAGKFERADTILDSIASLEPGTAVGVALFRQLVRAEQARQQFFAEGRLPEFLKRPEGVIELELRAAVALRAGDSREAAELIVQAESSRSPLAGKADGVPFEDFRDLDDLSAAHFEVLTSTGKYYWIPSASVSAIEFRPPERRRDLLWRRALMSVADGPDGEVFIPAIYGSAKQDIEAQYRLGHATDFAGGDNGPMLGIGLRSFLIGEASRTIHELGKVEFAPAARG